MIGLGQGTGTAFVVPFNVVFSRTGPVLLCAYGVYITDTAASTQLKLNVVSSPGKPKPTLAHRAKVACKAEVDKKARRSSRPGTATRTRSASASHATSTHITRPRLDRERCRSSLSR